MTKRILSLALSAIFTLTLLVGCSTTTTTSTTTATDDVATTTIVATTYPVYLLASALTAGVEDVTVTRLNTGDISCLHDYTLSVNDMKLIEGADIIAMNGALLEEFMDDALSQSPATAIYCDSDIASLYMEAHDHDHEDEAVTEDDHDHDHEDETVTEEEHDHDHEDETVTEEEHDHDHEDEAVTEEEHVHTEDCDHDHEDEELTEDPHFWMDPALYAQMGETLASQLALALPQHQEAIQSNLESFATLLTDFDMTIISSYGLITFHDGFQYFAAATGMELLTAIEEEAGSEASAQDIAEIISLVNDYSLPAIFTETNGSDSTAQAIARETGCAVYPLNMLMSGDDIEAGSSAQDIISTLYLAPMMANLETINEAMK